jgi:glucarate dehydratase
LRTSRSGQGKRQVKIEALRVTPIALGDPPLLNAAGLHAPWALRIVLEIETEVGIAGISEIPGDDQILAGLQQLAVQLRGASVEDEHALGQIVTATLGRESDDDRGQLSWDRRRLVHVRSALEVACLDIIGRRLDCRVVDLLGGAVRTRVPYAGYLFFKYEGAGGAHGDAQDPDARGWWRARGRPALDADGIVEQARAMREAFGFGSFKLKAGILEPDVEVAAILALRDAFGPSVPLRIDPNAVWSFETALAQGRRMQGAIEYYEDPVRGQAQMARLRRELAIPLATNMCTTTFADLASSIALESEDIILADHHFWGGLRSCMDLARISTVFGRALSMHSNSHAGISLAAMTHLAAALPELRYALDTHYPWQEDEIIQGGKLAIEDGFVQVPDGPGLGVEIDRSGLAAAHRNYARSELVRRDDELEMQRKRPGWRFMPTRY